MITIMTSILRKVVDLLMSKKGTLKYENTFEYYMAKAMNDNNNDNDCDN